MFMTIENLAIHIRSKCHNLRPKKKKLDVPFLFFTPCKGISIYATGVKKDRLDNAVAKRKKHATEKEK